MSSEGGRWILGISIGWGRRLALALIMVNGLFFGGTAALAAEGDTIPHGGYDTTTDACLQCHDVHDAEGDYVLSRWPTVVAMCGSCHTLYQLGVGASELEGTEPQLATDPVWAVRWDGGSGGTPDETDLGPVDDGTLDNPDRGGSDTNGLGVLNYNPNYYGLEAPVPGWSKYGDLAEDPQGAIGQGSPFEVYEKPLEYAQGVIDGLRGHRMGILFSEGDEVLHADGVLDELDYIPGGLDRLSAIATPSVSGIEDYPIENTGYPLDTVSVKAFPTSLAGGLYCASCHTPHAQFSGDDGTSNMIPSDIKSKLLSARPNHVAVPASFAGADDTWEQDGGREFCAKCHQERRSTTDGGPTHNHPDFACLSCHGMEEEISPISPNFGNPSNDFPHTSVNPNLLSQEPDGLCLTCHFPGGIPLP